MSERITSPRRLRAHRAAQRWAEAGNDLCGVPLAIIETACADAADLLRRDLDLEEVHKTCVAALRAAVHDREQAEAQRARLGQAEEQRLRYLAKRQADLLLTRDDEPRGRR